MKDRNLIHHLERKTHDWYAGLMNRILPLTPSGDHVTSEGRKLAENGRESLVCQLENRFYDRERSIENTVEYGPVHSYQFKQVNVVGDQGYIFRGSRNLISVCDEVKRINIQKARRPIWLLRRKIREPLFHLTGNNHNNHGHFVLQHLPRLMAARERLLANPRSKILLATGHLSWQRFYLERLGFGQDRLLEGTPGTMHCSHVDYIPFYFGPGNLVAAETYRAMRKLLAPGTPPMQDRYFFLSRKGATHRALLNEDEVFRACQKIWPKMERLDLNEHSSTEQVKLFQSARVIFGPHGQAFTNMIYTQNTLAIIANPGTTIRGWGAHFRNLSIQMGSEGIVLTAGIESGYNKANWIYPMCRLQNQLSKLQDVLPKKYR